MQGWRHWWPRRACGPCAPSGISFASVAAWLTPRFPLARSGRVPARPAGFALGHLLVLRHRIVLHDLALEDPHFHAAGAVGGKRRGDAVIDVGAQRMQRHAAFAVPFHARDFGAAQAAAAVNTNAERATTQSGLHGAFHRTAERDAALQLIGDAGGNKLRVNIRFTDFDDVEAYFAGGH